MSSSYCSEADIVSGGLKQAFVDQLSDLPGLINRASALIDSYLRGRYSLPLGSTPDEVKNCCVQLVIWYALQSLGWDPETGPDQSVESGYKEAITWLKDVSHGKASLNVASDATPSVNEGLPRVRSNAREPGLRGNCGRI